MWLFFVLFFAWIFLSSSAKDRSNAVLITVHQLCISITKRVSLNTSIVSTVQSILSAAHG